MGIFGFYSWLRNKCPKVVVDAIQEPTSDATSPNPNRLEFDNLYLDMNGIIHPCFHPDDLDDDLQPTSFEEVFNSVFEYVDRLFNVVRPRKLLYFAIDGVPPMAKMDLITKSRYQSARNVEISEQEEDRLRSQYAMKGKKLLPKAKSQVDDPNIITPGTEFLYEFCKALQGYIQTRLEENPAWKNLKVILSDANVPGEGEHKIVSFIRSQRSLPAYDVNTRHCIHGLDADLIMLALATHELHTSILREDSDVDSPRLTGSCKPFPVRKSFSYKFVHVWIIREYLELDMQPSDAPEGFKFDVERAVDDFIFICFFLGNDFLPCLPSLKVREGALDLLMTVYKREFKSLGGYLVDAVRVHDPKGAYLDLERVEKFVLSLGRYEDQIFEKRIELQERLMERVLRELLASVSTQRNDDARDKEIPIDIPNAEDDDILKNTKQLKEGLRKRLQGKAGTFKTVLFPADEIKCGTPGWKDRYYLENFAAEDHLELESMKNKVVKEYTEGLCWLLLYYFSGVPSWSWLYPYNYGPCASDMKGLGQLQVKFQEGVPWEPFEMLMSVLPPRSAEALPWACRKLLFCVKTRRAYAKLMKDERSDLIPKYTRAMAKEDLTEYEARRNSLNADLLFARALSDFGSQLLSKIVDDQSAVNGVGGFVNLIRHALDSSNGEDGILCVQFGLPRPSIQAPRILDNVNNPSRTVFEFDIKETTLWHEQRGGNRVGRAPNQSRYSGRQQSEPSRSAGLGWRGRDSESSGLPSSNSREGLYNPPNRSKSIGNPMPAPPRSPNSENNTWPSARFASTSQMAGQYENSSVSLTREGQGSGRERYGHATDNQGSQGGRGRRQFWSSRDSGSSEHW